MCSTRTVEDEVDRRRNAIFEDAEPGDQKIIEPLIDESSTDVPFCCNAKTISKDTVLEENRNEITEENEVFTFNKIETDEYEVFP